jgi:hypothetical protein
VEDAGDPQAPISTAKAPDFADFAEFADREKQAQHLEPQHISQTSHISQGKNGNAESGSAKSEDDGELF